MTKGLETNVMNAGGFRERVADLWRWRNVKPLIIAASAITVVLSLFELKLDAMAMFREVVSNFITCASITFITATLTTAVGMVRLGRDWKRFALLIVVLAAGGMLGGLLSWGVNELLFPYRISHPHVYMMLVAVLAIIFGLAILAYENVAIRLDETASKLAAKEIQQQRLLRLKTEAELEALRARVNPHFLFNTLNSIASLIPVDPGRAEDIVQRLSNLFHYILSAGDRGAVPLSEELDIVTQYLQIEKTRLGSRLDFSVDLGDGCEDVTVPVMLLQPLVENSVKHGIAPLEEGGRIDVACRREGDRVTITIVDTGRGFDTKSIGSGFGIQSVRQRLELSYPASHEFDISSSGGITSTRIAIPVTHEA